VIAGSTGAVDRAIEACKSKGARKALPLPVSVPSHCALMKGAAEELAEALDEVAFNDAVIPVVQNVSARPETQSDMLKANLVRQLYSPVLWTDSVRAMSEQTVGVAVECGAGKVLAGLAKRIDRNVNVYGIEDPDALKKALEGFGQ
jgi:[acyl-carrier-protein] S-malonyltransferase